MKKIHLFLIAILGLPLLLYGQNTREFSIKFDRKDFYFIQTGKTTQIRTKTFTSVYDEDCLMPDLPSVTINILIRPNESCVGFTYSSSEKLIADNIFLACCRERIPTNTPTNDMTEREYPKEIYPMNNDNVKFSGCNTLNGFRFLSFSVCPFMYDAINNKLYLKDEVKLKVTLKATSEKNTQIGKNINKYKDYIKDLVYNKSDVDIMYNNSFNPKSEVNVTEIYDYVVVTNESLKPAFQRLAKWKTAKGIRAKVLTTSAIDSIYSDSTQQIRIKRALEDYHNLHGTQYALLGGDVDIVPSQMCYLPGWAGTNDTPADLFYACFDNNFEWDANRNNLYGETTDSIDTTPEIVVTRVPVSSISEAESFVKRIIGYESFPDTIQWKDNILLGGKLLSKYINGVSDSQVNGENMFNNCIQPYWQDCERFRLFDTGTDHPLGASYDFIPENLQNELRKGYTFADISCHGTRNAWGWMEQSSLYLTNHADSLFNRDKTIITTISCSTNFFDGIDICLSEAFIRNPHSGILAYLGSSRAGWVATSPEYDSIFYKKLFIEGDYRFGPAVNACKNSFLSKYNYYNQYRWLLLTLNPLGDPEMPIFVHKPQYFNDISLSFLNNVLQVSTAVDSCTISIASACDGGESFFQRQTNTSSCYVDNLTSDYYVSVRKTGYVPYIARVSSQPMYIQDETFSSNVFIFSGDTYIGSDVTTEKENGPVLIEKGAVIMNSSGNVLIKNDFEISVGAELEITTFPVPMSLIPFPF